MILALHCAYALAFWNDWVVHLSRTKCWLVNWWQLLVPWSCWLPAAPQIWQLELQISGWVKCIIIFHECISWVLWFLSTLLPSAPGIQESKKGQKHSVASCLLVGWLIFVADWLAWVQKVRADFNWMWWEMRDKLTNLISRGTSDHSGNEQAWWHLYPPH